jgi:hypothetical protein
VENLNTGQPMPTKNDQPCVQDLVIQDLHRLSASLDRQPHIDDDAYALVIADVEARKAIGLAKYGTLLQPFNGRNALVDAYQEAGDLVQYLRQAKAEGTYVDITYAKAIEMLLHIRGLLKDQGHVA